MLLLETAIVLWDASRQAVMNLLYGWMDWVRDPVLFTADMNHGCRVMY